MAVQNLPSYAFDPHARVPANLITDERHTLTPKNGYTFHYIIPDYAPFYIKDLKVYKKTQQGAKTYLVEGVDFNVGYEFLQAVNSTGIPVYGAISFINRNLAGDIYLDYRTVGGDWTINQNKIAEIIADLQYNPVITTWEQVANIPYQFPPTPHSHDVQDLTSFSDLLNVLRRLGENLNGAGNINQQQVIDIVERTMTSNGKAAVGLSNLRNLEVLPLNNGNNNTDNYYVTPRGVRDIINAVAMPIINQHINARGNVHGLVAADIGAVTQADIDSRLETKLGKSEKAADSVLFDGRNSQELKTFVLDGTSSNTAKFNGLTYTEMVEDVKNRLNAILSAQGEENATNLAARMLQLTSGDTNKFGNRTPEQFATWLLANNNINATTLNGVTKDNLINEARSNVNALQLNGLSSEQLIAQSKQNVDAVSIGGRNLQQLLADAKQNVNATHLGGSTKEQIIADAKNNVNAVQLNGKSAQEIINEARRNVDATTIGGKTIEAFKAEIAQGVQAASTTIGGYTVQQIINEARTGVNADRFGGRDPETYKNYILSANNINAATLSGLSKDQLLAEARKAATLGGLTKDQLITQAKQNVDAATLGGKTLQQVIADAKANVVATNASRLEGKNVQTLTNEIVAFVSNLIDNTKVHMGNGINQHGVATQNSVKSNVVKIGKTTEDSGLPAVTIDSTDMGKMFLYRKALTTESINDLKQTSDIGIYSQASDSSAGTNLGYPERKAGTLLVIPAAYSVQQCYFVWNDGAIYSRYAERNNTWSRWTQTGIDSSKISHTTNGTDQSKIASEKAVGDLNRALTQSINTINQTLTQVSNNSQSAASQAAITQAVNNLKALLVNSSTNKIKEELLPTSAATQTALTQAINDLKAFFINSSTNKIKEGLLPSVQAVTQTALTQAINQATNDLKAFFIDSSTNRIKENLVPPPKWQ